MNSVDHQRQNCSNQGYMMQIIKAVISLIFFLPTISNATTDTECLNHLGGAFAGVECYNSLSNELTEENKTLINEIYATIPNGNKNKYLLNQYERHTTHSKKYCQLSRDSLTAWISEKHTINPRYYDYDVTYYECIYNILDNQNKFLKKYLGTCLRNNCGFVQGIMIPRFHVASLRQRLWQLGHCSLTAWLFSTNHNGLIIYRDVA